MNLLRAERDTLDAYLPGLDKYLSEIPLLELEQPGCDGGYAVARGKGGNDSDKHEGSDDERKHDKDDLCSDAHC